ncbi:MAG: YcxB family protein [Nitrospira sp.]|nr:YcxB family protein [Nitrospira sp.]
MHTDLHINVTLDDYRAFLSFVQTRAKNATSQGNNPILARSLTFFVWMGIGIAFLLLVNNLGGRIHLPSAIGAAVLVFIIVVSMIYWHMKKLQDQMLPQPDGAVLGSHLYQVREDALHVRSSFGTTQLAWRGIKSLEETPTHFFLFIDRSVGFILPKRSFATESQQNNFKSAVIERCGSTKNK